jgi:hypothetical protein
MENVEQTIISQYANSPTLVQLIQNMNQYIDPQTDFDNFYNLIWNVDTAVGFGLDIWGRIVGVTRNIQITGAIVNFGFKEGLNYQPFGQAPFYTGKPATNTYILADNAFRTLILVKALANISNSTIPSLNQLLQNMFAGRGRCYVIDNGGMQIRFVFEFALLPYELSIMVNSGAIPRPAGVSAKILQVDVPKTFGFKEAGRSQPFGQGALFNPTTGLINAS